MSVTIDENRWTAPADQFAVRIQVQDAPGFFSKKLIIEPGTRALVIEDGAFIGEVPAGVYTLESFAQRLRFWTKKQCTVILTRAEDQVIECQAGGLPTRENLVVEAGVRLTVQMSDVALFLQNLLGARAEFSVHDLRGTLLPLVRQAMWESVGRMSITELTGPQVRRDLDAAVEQALGVALKRYGIGFGQVQTVSVKHEKFDEHRQKVGETWLLREGLEQQRALDALYSEDELRKIQRQERTNELELLAENVGIDRQEGELAAMLRRVGIRSQLRDAVLADKFDKIETAEQLAQMLQQVDRDRLIRQEERDDLIAAYEAKRADRQAAREQLVRKLELEQQFELARLRADLDHQIELQAHGHEVELATRVENEDNRRWLALLERQRGEAEYRRREEGKEREHRRQVMQQETGDRREDQWQGLLHEQRIDRVQGELSVTRAERHVRLDELERQVRQARDEDTLKMQQRQAELQRQLQSATFQDQITKLAELNRLNAEFLRQRQQLDLDRQRSETELALLREDRAAQREMARLQAVKDLGVEALVATSSTANAEILARMKMHEASQQAAMEQARTSAAHQQSHRAEQERLYERLIESGKSQVDAIAQAYREGMAGQQAIAQGGFGALGQAAQATPAAVSPGPAQPAAGAATGKVVVCSSCRTENPPTARFCAQCGNAL
ncbi:MAG: hypothetical protein KJ000_24350 [Pirellulaceae bacterium]|nr:hypothetical protein [Pirellulaceae bacterium]